jgi:hypothetical protein
MSFDRVFACFLSLLDHTFVSNLLSFRAAAANLLARLPDYRGSGSVLKSKPRVKNANTSKHHPLTLAETAVTPDEGEATVVDVF